MIEHSPIICPYCGQRHPYPEGVLNKWRPCVCGAEWLITPDVSDEMPDPDEGLEAEVVPHVGTFEDRDSPGFSEPTHAVFRRRIKA